MSLAAPVLSRSAWVCAADPLVLDRIREEAVHLALWRRPRPAGLDWLDSFDLDDVDDVQETLAVVDLAETLNGILAAAGYPADAQGTALAAEIASLAHRFARVMDSDRIRMRLEVVETDACRKFHMDNVLARLLMPLTEPGTQWIEADAGPDAPVNHLRAGEVGLFKGRMWTETPAILHRSPPIADSGISRLLLVLDMPLQPVRADA